LTEQVYLGDPSLRGNAKVLEVVAGESPWVRLDRTWFHPQGGGQKSDVGTLGDLTVQKVAFDADGGIRHFVDAIGNLSVGDEVELRVDGVARDLHARLHSGGHLLAAVVEKAVPEVRAVAGHHWPGEARVDFEGGDEASDLAMEAWIAVALEGGVNADLDVVRSTNAVGRRTIALGDHPPVPCGGTHVASTLAIGRMAIVSIKRKKGRLRVRYDVTTSGS